MAFLTKTSPMKHQGKKPASLIQVRSHELYPSSITGASRQELLISVHPAAQRSILCCRLGQDFHHSPALCAVVQRVLVLVTAFMMLALIISSMGNVSRLAGSCRLMRGMKRSMSSTNKSFPGTISSSSRVLPRVLGCPLFLLYAG